jgi:arylsulfatase A-like enzyme
MPFGGVIKESARDSAPWWPPRVVPPKGAPNVLLIITDDQGYDISSTFGGVIPTPSLDRIAKAGLRYTQFHSTALCSPTRAALITGRNHHSVGYGVIGELSTGYPGYDSFIGPENATIGTILRDNGYATAWFGKDHNIPSFQYSVAGAVEARYSVFRDGRQPCDLPRRVDCLHDASLRALAPCNGQVDRHQRL